MAVEALLSLVYFLVEDHLFELAEHLLTVAACVFLLRAFLHLSFPHPYIWSDRSHAICLRLVVSVTTLTAAHHRLHSQGALLFFILCRSWLLLPCVLLLSVFLEMCLRAEGKLTLAADEELLTSTLPFVDVQTKVGAEGFATVALIWSPHPMNALLVLLQLRAMLKLLPTHVTLAGSIVFLLRHKSGGQDAVKSSHQRLL